MAAKKRKILTDLSPAKLAECVEGNLVEWVQLKGRLPNVELHCDSDVVWTFSSTNGRPNHICAARFKPETVDARLGKLVGYYHRRRTAVNWWVGPSATPQDLGRRLRDHGLSCRKHVPGLAIDLHDMNEEPPKPPCLTIDLIEDFSVFERFGHPSIGRISTTRRVTQLDDKVRLARMEPQSVWHFAASLKGEPLGVSTLFVGAGVAGVYDVAVIPKARAQGIGTATTVASLQFARNLGYRAAILQASGKGENIYKKIGFECVCTISHWYYSKAKACLSPASDGRERHWNLDEPFG